MDTKNTIKTLSQSLLDEVKKIMKKEKEEKSEKGESEADEKREHCSEALKGDQHKIDANKNGKVDAHDFKLLRKKKGVAEVYTAMKTGEEISEEEVEQIDELSRKTMASYIKGAAKDIEYNAAKRQKFQPWENDKDPDIRATGRRRVANADKAIDKRMKGTSMAATKLAKEEVEELDELSKGTLASYIKKASTSAANAGMEHGAKKAERDEVDRMTNRHMSFDDKDKIHKAMKTTHRDVEKPREKAGKRIWGINKAVDKITKEEVELTQEEIDRLDAILVDLDEGRGRPPKEGSEAWKKRQAEGAAAADEPRQHPIQQLERIKRDMRGGGDFLHKDGSTHHLKGGDAAKLLDKYHGLKPAEKEDMQREIHASHAGLKKHL